MIVFDLECEKGHTFEAWFKDSKAYESQQANGQLECPVCGDRHVKKVLSPVRFNKGAKGQDFSSQEAMLKVLERAYHHIIENSEDVGTRFASEALKIHYGVTEPRNIRGVASQEEEKMLREEGVEFFRIPVPAKKKEDKNN